MNKEDVKDLQNYVKCIRRAVADYMQSEGCSCCSASEHSVHKERLAKLLRVPKYKDGSGYNFSKFISKGI